MNFMHLMLKRLGPFLNWNHMLDYSCVITFDIIVRSSCVHAKTYWYYLKRQTNSCFPWGVQQVPRLTNFGSTFIPRFIYLCDKVELWGFALTSPLKQFFNSYNFSNDTTPLGMGFFFACLSCILQHFLVHVFFGNFHFEHISVHHKI